MNLENLPLEDCTNRFCEKMNIIDDMKQFLAMKANLRNESN